MSGYIFQDEDAIEPISDTLGEIWGNLGLYSVILPQSGSCALTYSAANLTVDLAAGRIVHFGVPVTVTVFPAAYTLLPDPSFPRWVWLTVASNGGPVMVSGDPATVPTVPELGDRVAIALVYVQAGLSIASNATYKIDKRAATASGALLVASSDTAQTSTSTSAASFAAITVNIPKEIPFRFEAGVSKDASAAQSVAYGLLANATTVDEANNGAMWHASSATQRAEEGLLLLKVGSRGDPGGAVTLASWISQSQWSVSSSGAISEAPVLGPLTTPTGRFPNATITSLTPRVINNTSSNNAALLWYRVYVDL